MKISGIKTNIWMRIHQDNQDRGGRMFSTALSGVDTALWDLGGKALGVPVHALLGVVRDKIRVYANGLVHESGDARPERGGSAALWKTDSARGTRSTCAEAPIRPAAA